MANFYITTTLPYVNADPHIGFAVEIIRADVLARMHRLTGDEVFFNTGTDEHGQKIYDKAVEANVSPQSYCDEYAEKFQKLKESLNLSYDRFIRTTDIHHVEAAQEFWKKCQKNGDIYKKNYKVKYCVGCEMEKTDSELDNGKCPIHPKMEIQIIEEENFFFRFSKYQGKLLELYEENKEFVKPEFRQNEITVFVKNGLQDFSISRLKKKMPWGIDVPGDEEQVIYVWFDALINYISTLGWPNEEQKFNDFWPGIQICGKDNLRQQSAMWQAMLMSAGLPTSKQIVVGGFLTSGGQKISKSLGNTIDPIDWADRYGTDTLRYYLMSEINVFEDSDVTEEKLKATYERDLVNGIGNLASRVAAMAEKSELIVKKQDLAIRESVVSKINEYRFDEAIDLIWEEVRRADVTINQNEVWRMEGDEQKFVLSELVGIIRQIATDLLPILPATAEKLLKQFAVEEIRRSEILFPRLTK